MDSKLTIFAIPNGSLSPRVAVGNQAGEEAAQRRQFANRGQRQNKTGKAP